MPTMPEGSTPQQRPPAGPDVMLCSICQALIASATLDDHLREAHGLYTYRGVRRERSDTLEAILGDLIRLRPDEVAWQGLVQLGQEERGLDADRFVAETLAQGLGRLDERHLVGVCTALAPLIAPISAGLFLALVEQGTAAARRLAIMCAPSLRGPYDRRVRRVLRGLCADGKLPLRDRLDALVVILPHLEERRASRLLMPLLVGRRRRDAVALLEHLQGRLGALPILTTYRDRLEDKVRMSCPRCGVELRRHHMIAHLWAEHRLVLEGTRVRDPWTLIEEWLDAARATGDRELVDRCRVAVEKIDPTRGRGRLMRMLLARGLADPASKRAFLNEAREQSASCCPRCYALVPMPDEQAPLAVKLRQDRLEAAGYRVAIDEQGLRPVLDIVTPGGVVFHGQEPDHPWTASGAAFLYACMVVLLALLLALLWPRWLSRPIQPVAILLLIAWLVHFGVRLAYRTQAAVSERLVEYAWQYLVPELHAGGFRVTDAAFAGGLAAWHSRQARWEVSQEQLGPLVRQTEAAVERGEAPAGYLAALVRLQIELAAEEREDPVPLVVRWVTRSFQGKLPLSFTQHLLENWTADWWTKLNLARLRVLLCDRAFEAGFEVQTLLDAGQTAPALGTVLRTDAPRSLAALRLLWSMRPTRPWDKLGEVQTAFELAADPQAGEILGEHPDLLLYELDRRINLEYEGSNAKPGPVCLVFTLAGVWLQGVIFSIPPRLFELHRRTFGTQLMLGGQLYRSTSDLDGFARELERWFRWVFHEYLPMVDRVLTWQSPHRDALLRAWGAVPCPECGKALLPGLGEVGIAVEEKAGEERGQPARS